MGDIVEEWTLKGTWISTVNFGALSFDASDPTDITVTLRYDYAILQF